MNKSIIISAILLLLLSLESIMAQSKMEWFITANANTYIPLNNKENKPYPILWYGKSLEDKNKILIGGIGIGVSGIYQMQGKWKLKANLNFSRRAFYDESFQAVDGVGNYIYNPPVVRTEEYLLNSLLMPHFAFNEKISVGVGVGLQTLISSKAQFYALSFFNDVEKQKVKNSFYRTILPTLPIEFSWRIKKISITTRYEQSLLSRLRGDAEEKNSFGQLFFEIGYLFK